MGILKSPYGSARAYTRHRASCPQRKDQDYNACNCTKWLWFRRADGVINRVSLNTHSFAEAQSIAAYRLQNMDPGIAAARAAVGGHASQPLTIKEACDRWLQQKVTEVGNGTRRERLLSVENFQEWASNLGIVHIQEVTPVQLRNWYNFRPWNRVASTTRVRRKGILSSMFRYWHDEGILDDNPFSWAGREARRETRPTFPGDAASLRSANRCERVTVNEACDLWRQQMQRQLGKTTYKQYSMAARRLESWAEDLGVVLVQAITSRQIEEWYASESWLNLAPRTRRQRWAMIRAMFQWWRDLGILERNPASRVRPVKSSQEYAQGPFSESQVRAILEEVASDSLLRAFVLFLLHTGSDVIDAVLFNPARIEDLQVKGKTVSVYRFLRRESGVEVAIPLPAEVVSVLRSIVPPANKGGSLPFRKGGITLAENEKRWSVRVQMAMRRANVEWIELPKIEDCRNPQRRRANCHQFKHHFAVQQLRAGQTADEVASQLGCNADSVRRLYEGWLETPDFDRNGKSVL